jgi:hypothetical protein
MHQGYPYRWAGYSYCWRRLFALLRGFGDEDAANQA